MGAEGAFGPRALLLAGLAARVLGWRPAEFWTATPAELAAALGLSAQPGSALDTHGLRQLMERFPDGR
jgi:uncharacterized phage protein (TIGR02216 family)